MISQANAGAWSQQTHPCVNPHNHQCLNALKHGIRSDAILVPGDDVEAFRRLRQELFHDYRPGTRDEAACVETMAGCHWRIARCRRWQGVLDAQVDGTLFPGGAPAGHICEPDSHRWQHKADDCTRQEGRLERHLCRAREKLFLLQKQRRKRLVLGVSQQDTIYWPEEPRIEEEVVSPPQDAPVAQGADGGPGGPGCVTTHPQPLEPGHGVQPPPADQERGAPLAVDGAVGSSEDTNPSFIGGIRKKDERSPGGSGDRTPQPFDGHSAELRAPAPGMPGGRTGGL